MNLLSRCSAFLALAGSLFAQSVPDGYSSSLHSLPNSAGYPAVLTNAIAWFDGTDVTLQETGLAPRSLLHFSVPRFGAFLVPLRNGALLFADSSFGDVYLLATSVGALPILLNNLILPYDAAELSPTTVVISAKTGGFGASDNDLIRLDLTTGVTTALGSVGGASGALAIDAHGDLIYATAPQSFPAPSGSVQILRWSALQITLAQLGAGSLSLANAQVMVTGLDAVGDLALDTDDDLFFIDWLNGTVGEINQLHQSPWTTNFIDYTVSNVSCGTLQFIGSSGEFEPYSTTSSGELCLHETDFLQVSQLRKIQPRSAGLTAGNFSVIPRGPFTLQVQQATPNGIAIFGLALAQNLNAFTLTVQGFEQSIPWDNSLFIGITSFAALDALGHNQLQLNNPGLPAGTRLIAACAFSDSGLQLLGATQVRSLLLAP
ncbi:MAG: hypothetical protein EXS02_07800 [Planctomycetes bacterium]|nr:hypothetical protein [Planctomycetota bacterium]